MEKQKIYEVIKKWDEKKISFKRAKLITGYSEPHMYRLKKEKEYRPFYDIKGMYPRYLFVLDLIIKDNINGIKNINIAKFIAENQDL